MFLVVGILCSLLGHVWGVEVSLPDTTVHPGDTLVVPLSVDDASEIAGMDVTVSFSSDVLQVINVRTTPLTNGFTLADTLFPGSVRIMMAHETGIPSGSGALVEIVFYVIGSEGESSVLGLSKLALYDEFTEPILAEAKNGTVEVVSVRPLPLGAPSDLEVTEVTDNYIGLRWKDNSSQELGIRIERRQLDGEYMEVAVTNKDVTTFAVTNLKPETTYFFRVRAYNRQGYSDYSNEISATTKASVLSISPYRPLDLKVGDVVLFHVSGGKGPYSWRSSNAEVGEVDEAGVFTARDKGGCVVIVEDANGYATSSELILVSTGVPEAPGDLEAEAVSPTQVDLSWVDHSDDESGFTIEYRPSDGEYRELWCLPRNITSFSAAGLRPNTIYFFRVKAYNAYGPSEYSNEVTVATPEAVIKVFPDTSIILSPGQWVAFRAEGGSKPYTWSVSNPSVGTVDVAGIFTAKAEGAAVVMAEDQEGNRASSGIIVVDADLPYPPGELEAEAVSTSQIDLRWCDYSDNELGFKVEMKRVGGEYSEIAALPKNSTSYCVRGLEENTTYFFRVIAYNANGPSKPSNEVSKATLRKVSLSTQVPSMQYRMISLPFAPENGDPEIVLGDELGPYERDILGIYKWHEWRLFRWKGGNYQEYPRIEPFEPGKAFWLIVRKATRIGADGVSTDHTSPFRIKLEPGWNQIGCPFEWEVDWAGVQVEKDGEVFSISQVEETGVEERLVEYVAGAYRRAQKLKPWHGYWVHNRNEEDVTLIVPPPGAAKHVPHIVPEGWIAELKAELGSFLDADNRFGQVEGAEEGWDRWDATEPPLPPERPKVRLYFAKEGQELSYDLRPPEGPQVWRFFVEAEGDVVLRAEGLPRGKEVYLMDMDDGNIWEISKGAYIYESQGRREFRLVAGDAEQVMKVLSEISPEEFMLGKPYPNPFNSMVVIPFSISHPGEVEVAIYNLKGQVMWEYDGWFAPGWHKLVWDGRDRLGKEVGSGVYLVRMFTEGKEFVEKAVMVK